MKTNILLFIALFAFVFNSCKDDTTTTPTSATPVDTFPYDGEWTGNYIGGDEGTVTITVESNGKLNGSAYSNNIMSTFSLNGMVDSTGKLNATSTTTGAIFSGNLSATNASGIWENTTISGTWTATKK
jgi:hypothetical protein